MLIAKIALCYVCSLNFVQVDPVLRFWRRMGFSRVVDISDKHVASFFVEKFRPSGSFILPKKKINDTEV
jgi:hypothetical protein